MGIRLKSVNEKVVNGMRNYRSREVYDYVDYKIVDLIWENTTFKIRNRLYHQIILNVSGEDIEP
jgi:hypothetical protein